MCSPSLQGTKNMAIGGPAIACITEAQQTPQDISSKAVLYLISTSEITGLPKGATVQPGAYCAGARDQAKVIGFEKSSRFL